jgi:hypothetical protein
MSDLPKFFTGVPSWLDPKRMAALDDFCNKVMRGQLEQNKRDPRLAALEKQWETMDRFSKRELGPGDVKK